MKKKREFDFLDGRKLQISLLKMKVTVLLLLVCVLQSMAGAYSQTAKYDISMTGGKLENVFKLIEQKGEYTFLYSIEDVDQISSVNVNVKQADLKEVLDICLANTKLMYEINGRLVIIRVKDEKPEDKMVVIKGVVKDKRGEPLPGVTIIEKGTTVGVATGIDGKFTFNTTKHDNIVLVFSFVGMKTKEVKWVGQKELDIILEEDALEMEEVVVTGYQSINRRDMVGSYSTVKASDIMMPAYSSIDQMLQGQVAGMMVINTSSRIGASPKIKIRGTSTILGNQDPLWVVDGIIQEDPIQINATTYMTEDLSNIIGSQISWLNPQDIETITVLKDASATAVYGSKASNGVIVVTTKKGKSDRLTINYTGNLSINTRPNYGMFNLMNSKERIQFSEDAFANKAIYLNEPVKQYHTYEGIMKMYIAGELSQDEFFDRKEQLETVNTDWFKLLTRSAVSHNHNLSISGGTEKVTYNVSAGYSSSLGQEIGNSQERLTGRVAVNAQLRKNIRTNVTINAVTSKTKGFGQNVNPMSYATTTSRALPAYDENGDLLFYRKSASYLLNNNVTDLGYNFINERDNSGSSVETSRFNATLDFSWDITDWLKYQFTGGYTRDNKNNESYRTEKTFGIAENYRGYDYNTVDADSPEFKSAMLPFGGELFTSDALQSSYNIQNKLLVSKSFNPDNRLNIMVAMELRSTRFSNNSNTVWGYAPDRGGVAIQPTPPDELVPISNTSTGWGILRNIYKGRWKKETKTDNFLSFFGTFAYSLKNRYIANVTIRNDASNRFGQDANNRFDPTYSFGLAWHVTEEDFMREYVPWLSALNINVTYGIQGNALTSLSPDLLLHQMGVADLYNQYYTTISSIPNPHLSWERTRSWDIGVDLELFKMFSVAFDYYTRRSNAIVSNTLPFEYGTTTTNLNGGIVHNRGVEFTVSFTPVKTEDWVFNVSLNSSKNWNETGESEFNAKLNNFLGGASDKILKKGYPLGGFWSYSFAGLSSEDGRPLFNLLDMPEGGADPEIDPTTFLVYSGTSEPDFTGGINLGLRYKSFNLSSSFALLIGSKKRLPSPYANFPSSVRIPEPDVNLSRDLLKRWQKPGDEKYTDIPALVTSARYNIETPDGSNPNWIEAWAQSDVRVVNASFFRCRQLTLTWNMDPAVCGRVGLKSLSLNASVNNLFVIASKRFNGFDPELGDSVMPKVYSFGVNVGF